MHDELCKNPCPAKVHPALADRSPLKPGKLQDVEIHILRELTSGLPYEVNVMGLYEPIHGFAPDIAGKRIANPIGTILSAAMMMDHSFKLESEACAIEGAVNRTVAEGVRTADIGGTLTTRQMTNEITKRMEEN